MLKPGLTDPLWVILACTSVLYLVFTVVLLFCTRAARVGKLNVDSVDNSVTGERSPPNSK